MIKLPFGCHCTELKVNPKNWQTNKASIKKDWFIYYRFYDPRFKTNPKFKKGKLVVLKGMNQFTIHEERISKTLDIIGEETKKLKEKGFNPITSMLITIHTEFSEIAPYTPFMDALEMAAKRLVVALSTKRDIKSTLESVRAAAFQLRYFEQPISSITRKHLKQVLMLINITMGDSPYRHNKIRSYLMMIYKELVELEVVDSNPVKDISKRKTIQRLRDLPTMEVRRLVSEHLKANHYEFWLFMQIFFHSGARLTEMMLVKRKHVNLEKQTFRIIIKKGRQYKEVDKPIKNIALSFWIEAVKNAEKEDYIFSKNLQPGPDPIRSFQITKRWNRLVKKKLGIEYDFYTLKHLNLDETAALIGITDAAAFASHTSTSITLKHYAVNELQRQNERLKNLTNGFAD